MLAKASDRLGAPFRFVVVGFINTFAGLSIIYVLIWLFPIGDVAANLIGYGVGIIVSFFLNGRWTFAFHGSMARAAPRFVAVLVLAYLANLATVTIATNVLSLNRFVAQAMGVLPYALVSYFGSKHFVFTKDDSRLHGRL
jgi:putative flippase GtrA